MFRFEVAAGEVVLELCEGKAEIFGTELVQHRRYTFSTGTRVAVFSWHGAVVELVGTTEGAYVASQTPMAIYVNTHAGLEQMRSLAERGGHRGPIMMVVGEIYFNLPYYSNMFRGCLTLTLFRAIQVPLMLERAPCASCCLTMRLDWDDVQSMWIWMWVREASPFPELSELSILSAQLILWRDLRRNSLSFMSSVTCRQLRTSDCTITLVRT